MESTSQKRPSLLESIVSRPLYVYGAIAILVVLMVVVMVLGFGRSLITAIPGSTVGTTALLPETSGDEFSTLLSLLEQTGLDEVLAEGGYTVFAPTNAAFEGLPTGVVDALLADEELLKSILLYHVVGGQLTADELLSQGSATTAQTEDVEIYTDAVGNIRVNQAKVISADAEISGNTIHSIDDVLIADSLVDDVGVPVRDIVDVAFNADNFSTLITALDLTDLRAALEDDEGAYTVFAPTDDAFAALPASVFNKLLDDSELLKEVLLYHVVGIGDEPLADWIGTQQTTLQSEEVSITGNPVVQNNEIEALVNDSNIVASDILATNGRVHVIDAVLVPESLADELNVGGEPQDDIVDTAIDVPNLTTLVTALKAADLVETLRGAGPFTVFAPTDDAFAALPDGVLDTLLDDTDLLADVLLYHVLSGEVFSDDLISSSSEKTLQGESVAVSVSGDFLRIDESRVLRPDVEATNGVIHTIDSVLIPDTVASALNDGDDNTNDNTSNGNNNQNTTTTPSSSTGSTTRSLSSTTTTPVTAPVTGPGQVLAVLLALGFGALGVILYVIYAKHHRKTDAMKK